jgi:hypothetical protein
VAEADCCPGLHCYHVPAPWDDNTYCQSELVAEDEVELPANVAVACLDDHKMCLSESDCCPGLSCLPALGMLYACQS